MAGYGRADLIDETTLGVQEASGLAQLSVPEGITTAADGQVWVCTDGEGHLRRLVLRH